MRAPEAQEQDPSSIVAAVEEQAEKETNLRRIHSCYYVVVDGDTLNSVASYFGCPMSLLQSYNNWVGAISKFEVGTKLHIPAVQPGREGRCTTEKRATEADERHQKLVEQMRTTASTTVGAEVRRAFDLRERVHRELAKHNVELRKAAHKQCKECDEARREEVRKLHTLKRDSERREEGTRREKAVAAALKEKEATEDGAAAVAAALALPACVYTARGDDTYGSISQRFGIPLSALREANDLVVDASNWYDRPATGRVVRVPRAAIKARVACDAEVDVCPYVVRRGDSLGSVADKFGTSRAHIAIVNKLPSTDFGFWPKLDSTLLIPKPSDEGATECLEAPKKMVVGVPVARDVGHVAETAVPATVDNEARAEDAEKDAQEAAGEADKAKNKAERLMREASAAREAVTKATAAREAASEAVLAARSAYKATLDEPNKGAQRAAMSRLDAAEKKQRDATAALEKARADAADASEAATIATTVWQKRTDASEAEAAVSEAHSAQEEAEAAQDEGEPDAGKTDLDYADHSHDPKSVEERATAQMQEAAAAQLEVAKEDAARNKKLAAAAAEREQAAKEHAVEVQMAAAAKGEEHDTAVAVTSLLEAAAGNPGELGMEEELDAHLAAMAMARAPPQKKKGEGKAEADVPPELEYTSPEEAAEIEAGAREATGATGLAAVTSATGMAAAEEVAAAAEEVTKMLASHKEAAKQEAKVAAADEARAEAERAAVVATEQAATLRKQVAEAAEAAEAAEEKAAEEKRAAVARAVARAMEALPTGGATGAGAGEGESGAGLMEGGGSDASAPAGPADLVAELEAERRRRVRVEGKLVTLTHELQDAHEEAAAAERRAEVLRQERAALERRLRVADASQARAEEQVREAARAAGMVREDAEAAAALATRHQEAARRSANGLGGMTGAAGTASSDDEPAELDACSRAAQAQADAHEQSLRMKMAKEMVGRRRARLDTLQDGIEARDAALEEVEEALRTASRELKREVAQREAEATAFTHAFDDHMKAADGARKIRGALMHSRIGLLNGDLRAYGGPAAERAERARAEVDAVAAVKKGVRSGALPASWLRADGELTAAALKEVERVVNTPPAIVDGQPVLGYTREGKPILDDGSMTARVEAETLDPSKQAAAMLERRRAATAQSLLELGSSKFSKSPAQRSSVRRLREYLRRLTEAAHLSLDTLRSHETDAHDFFRTLHTEVEPRLDALHAEHRRLVRERSRMQAERLAVQEDMQHQVVAMEDAQREYNMAAESVMTSLERCANSAHSLHEVRQ